MRLTQKNFDKLIINLNHRMTSINKSMNNITNDLKWTKRFMGYMATLLTLMVIVIIGGIF